VRFYEKHAKQLLHKIGIDTGIDCPLTSRTEHLAHPLWLNDRSITSLLHMGYVAADIQAASQQLNDGGIDLVYLCAQLRQ
jgi:hypothetical protein